MTTTFTLSRGQRFDSYPIYVKPQVPGLFGLRDDMGRLADIFEVLDPPAVMRNREADLTNQGRDIYFGNTTDDPEFHGGPSWGEKLEGYIAAGQGEAKISAGIESYKTRQRVEDFRQRLQSAATLDYDETGKSLLMGDVQLQLELDDQHVLPVIGSTKK